MVQVDIYTKNYCSFCHRAKDLLKIKNVNFTEYDVTHNRELEEQMRTRSGRRSVPQIFIDDQHIGGCDELFALDEKGKLDSLLG